jgi:uncharacterized protein YndB with AHSA1/START domain
MSMEPIRRSVTVGLDRERAFTLFTEEMGSWWPVEMHSRAVDDFEGEGLKVERIEFQPRAGGQVLETMSNGRTLPWGDVLEWEPPVRFVLAWNPSFSERPPTEVEVRFTAGPDGTLVELEHRGWERLGPDVGVARLHDAYGSGWVPTLERFRAAAAEAA